MTNNSTAVLSDRELLDATARAADCERQSTAELISLLAELDTRKLYLGAGYSSLFTYVTLALHLSEPAGVQSHHGGARGAAVPGDPDDAGRRRLDVDDDWSTLGALDG